MSQDMNAKSAAPPRTAEEWNSLWSAKQAMRSMAHGSEYWNARARTYTNKDNPHSYTAQFIQMAQVHPGDTIFDMGCGTGNLTIPLAEAGHEVLAADFSTGMLAKLEEAVAEKGLQGKVRTMQLSWDDDWEAAGLHANQFDVCFASRSIATDDLLGALTKLNSVAKRRACITLPYGISPRSDDRMLKDIGFDVQPSYDSAYAVALLSAMGQLPCLSYIPTTRNDAFESMDAAMERYWPMAREYDQLAGEIISDDALRERVRAWLEANLVPDAAAPGMLTLKTPRNSYWSFVSWDKSVQEVF